MQAARKIKEPEEILALYFERKKSKVGGYSLRALARDIQKSPAYVSQVLAGKRRLSPDLYGKISEVLELDVMARKQLSLSVVLCSSLPEEVKADLESSLEENSGQDAYGKYEESHLPEFDILRNWYFVSILDLVTLSNFKPDISWIAKKLKISHYQADMAVKALFAAKLLTEENGLWKKTKFKMVFSTKSSKETVRVFHKQMIEKAVVELTTKTHAEAFQKRLITGLSTATNPQNIERAKHRLNEMIFELSEILAEGECTELYQLNIQLFMLTEEDV
jgi:uncharacterized protein (TIGR02147 family)